MSFERSCALMKALADVSRLRIVQSLLDGPRYVEELAERLGLSPSTVSFHLKKLQQAGLVSAEKEQYYRMYRANEGVLDLSLRNIVDLSGGDRSIEEKRLARYVDRVLETFFEDGRLIRMPSQRKKRRIVLEAFVRDLEMGRIYSEPEINEIILRRFEDYCLIRREWIDEGLVARSEREYRRLDPTPGDPLPVPESTLRQESNSMNDRKQIKAQYKLTERVAGIYWVRNRETGRALLCSSLSLDGKLNRHRFLLRFGNHQSEALQKDWNMLGEEGFDFEIVETVRSRTDPGFNVEAELKALEQKWIEKMQPFEERCYNRNQRIRTNPF